MILDRLSRQRSASWAIMAWALLFLSVLADAILSPLDAKGLVVKPPKIVAQSPQEVWFAFQQKFTLECEAAGNIDPQDYTWYKNGEPIEVDGEVIRWARLSFSGSIEFMRPTSRHQGTYQCRAKNILGMAVSDFMKVQLGSLDHFVPQSKPEVHHVGQGEALTLRCNTPYGNPTPTVFWVYRSPSNKGLLETIKRNHITVDGDGNLQFSHVLKHDGRSDILYQCGAASPVLRKEYRSGDDFKLIVSDNGTFSKEQWRDNNLIGNEPIKAPEFSPPKKLWLSPEHVTVKAGDRLQLTCIFQGYPLPQVTWSTDKELPEGRYSYEDYSKTLIIKRVKPEDAGTYVCTATSDAYGSLKVQHRMTVQVTATPYWTNGAPHDIELPEDQNAQLRCLASGKPNPVISWSINGIPLHQVEPNPRLTVLEGGKILNIEKVNHDVDTAVYQCNASNSLGYVFANAYINALAFEPKFLTPINQTLMVPRQSTVDLDCSVKAAPLPKVKWVTSDNHFVSVTGRNQLLKNHTLRIRDVQIEDEGSYYCNVSNRYGLNRAKRLLKVYENTYWIKEIQDREVEIIANESISFECAAQPDSRLDITYAWLKDGKLLDVTEHAPVIRIYRQCITEFSLERANKLVLKKARGRHSGYYTCFASTPVDSLESTVRLAVKDVPETPELIGLECGGEGRHALLKWHPSHANFDPIKRYMVQYQTTFRPGWRTAMNLNRTIGEVNEVEETLVSLSPWVNYTFRVIAENSFGKSVPGVYDKRCNTRASVPYKDPMNVSAEGTEKDNLVIYWRPMPKEHWNGPGYHVNISYRLNEAGAEWHAFEVHDPLQDHVIIRDQPTFRQYQVMVRSVNDKGPSIAPKVSILGHSGEDYPTEAPRNFNVTEIINDTAAQFVWTHVAPESLKGRFYGYKVRSWEMDEPKNPWQSTVFSPVQTDIVVGNSENSAIGNHFEAMKTYKVNVRSYNSRFEGPPSQHIVIRMPEGKPSEVRNLVVRAVGSQSILAEWDEPEQIRGILHGYFVKITEMKEGADPYETFILKLKTHYLWVDAKPDTEYNITVMAKTGGGKGPWVNQTATTYSLQSPGQPSIETKVLDAHRVEVTWIQPKDKPPGNAFYLNYSSTARTRYKTTRNISLPDTSYLLVGLESNTEYSIYLTAHEDKRHTTSKQFLFRTPSPTSNRRITPDNLTSAAWFIAIICAVVVAVIAILACCIHQRSRGGKYPVKKKEQERGTPENEEERSFIEFQYGSSPYKDKANVT